MDYQDIKREAGKDAAKVLGILFFGLPIGIFVFVALTAKIGALKTLALFVVSGLAIATLSKV